MEGPSQQDFQQVSGRISDNIERINELLSNAVVESEVVSREELITNFLSTKQSDFIINEPTSEYYDLDRMKKLFEMMEIKPENLEPRLDSRKKPKSRAESTSTLTTANLDSTFLPPKPVGRPAVLPRSESVASTKSSVSAQSNEDVTSSGDSRGEIKNHISDIRQTLQSITNGYIATPDLTRFEAEATAMNVRINDANIKVNRLLKELQSIASSDQSPPTQVVPGVDDTLIASLEQLSQTLSDIKISSSNPIGDHPKSEDCSFRLTKSINRILEAFENNPMN